MKRVSIVALVVLIIVGLGLYVNHLRRVDAYKSKLWPKLSAVHSSRIIHSFSECIEKMIEPKICREIEATIDKASREKIRYLDFR